MAKLEEQLAKMVTIDVEIRERKTNKLLKQVRGGGMRHNIITVKAAF